MPKCDISKTGTTLELLRVAPEHRDIEWRKMFNRAVVDASFASGEPQVIEGADGFPYFHLVTPKSGKPFQAYSISLLLDGATDSGTGIALNVCGDSVDWVFRYGDLVSLRMLGHFEAETPLSKLPEHLSYEMKDDSTVIVGEPDDSVLPVYCRRAIARYMRDNLGVRDPGVLLLVERKGDVVAAELVFSLFPRSEDEAAHILECLSWFLPDDYNLAFVAKGSALSKQFYPM